MNILNPDALSLQLIFPDQSGENDITYHVFMVWIESLIDQRELVRAQPLLVIDQLSKLEKERERERGAERQRSMGIERDIDNE